MTGLSGVSRLICFKIADQALILRAFYAMVQGIVHNAAYPPHRLRGGCGPEDRLPGVDDHPLA